MFGSAIMRTGFDHHAGPPKTEIDSQKSRAPIIVFDADDIVFTEIAPGLNLDQFKRNLAWILQPVHGADRNVNRFILVHGRDGVIHGHACRAPHHDPMFGTVVMFLQ